MHVDSDRLVSEHEAYRRLLARTVDEAVARILADAEHAVADRRRQRERWMKAHAGTSGCVIRDCRRKKTL